MLKPLQLAFSHNCKQTERGKKKNIKPNVLLQEFKTTKVQGLVAFGRGLWA